MTPMTPKHTASRRRREQGKSNVGCLFIVLGLVALWIICSVGGQIFSLMNRGRLTAENRNTEAHRTAEDSAARAREEAARKAAEQREQMVSYATGLAQTPPPARLTRQPYIRGKEVIVEGETDESSKKSETTYRLKSTDATSMDDAGTIIALRYYDVKTGNYIEEGTGYTQSGYRTDCEVTIIDRSIPAVIYKKTMRGTRPGHEVTVRQGGKIVGDPPDVDAFLQTLPRLN